MRARRLLLAAAGCSALLLPAACGRTKDSPSTATPRPATEIVALPTRAVETTTPVRGSAVPQPTPTASTSDATATPGLTPPAGSRFEPAPIDGAELVIEKSNPVQYAVNIRSGLPSGCHVFDHATLTRAGSEIKIDVVNRLPADSRIACTAIYGTHETTVQLGSDFASRATYRVHVNDRTIEFTAQ